MLTIFESKARRIKDTQELTALFRKYGDETVGILKNRTRASGLADRDRRHWKRLMSKARFHQ